MPSQKVQDLPDEIWKAIEGYEDWYEVSNMGRVRSLDRYIEGKDGVIRIAYGRVLRQIFMKNTTIKGKDVKLKVPVEDANEGGVTLYMNGEQVYRSIGRLVLEAFCGPKPSPEYKARAIEGKADFRLDNLIWCK